MGMTRPSSQRVRGESASRLMSATGRAEAAAADRPPRPPRRARAGRRT
jgi:hypothetical protein